MPVRLDATAVQLKTEDFIARAMAALMPLISRAVADVDRAVRRLAGAGKRGAAPMGGEAKRAKTDAPAADAEQRYKEALGPLQYDDAEDAAAWRLPAASPARPHPAFRRRMAQEHVDISHALPLNLASSAWCRCHPSRMDALRVAISAPEGTPYAAGVFVFDVRFPPGFPSAPPSVTLLTTGRGTVRFNPNLYECGKVCLSLLGTWEGKGGETWNAETSTLLQVLVSIQALIFVPTPYYNEPGFESQMGTPVGDHRSAKYAASVREHCVRWAMIDQLRHPAPEFAEVVRLHFAHRRDFVLGDLDAAIADATRRETQPAAPPAAGAPAPAPHEPKFWRTHRATLTELRQELQRLLDAPAPAPAPAPAAARGGCALQLDN